MSDNMMEIKPPVEVAQWVGGASDGFVRLLDQTRLPEETVFLDCKSLDTLWDAIKRLVVRGAPAIGIAAGYGMVLGCGHIAVNTKAKSPQDLAGPLRNAGEYLSSSRPTAVNLDWAIARMLKRFDSELAGGCECCNAMCEALLAEARDIHTEDVAMCLRIGNLAADLIRDVNGVLTHCNAGALATGGIGTATAGMYVAHATGHVFRAYCDETRPLLQGSRLTAWELMQAGIDTTVICDNMAAQVMRESRVQLVITGADRIAANGDTANKIGTYGVAILAARHNIPFYVAAPYSTFDMSLPSGDSIPIEIRGSEEICEGFGRRTAPAGADTYSPAFDVTPAELIAGIITDRGMISPVNEETVRSVLGM